MNNILNNKWFPFLFSLFPTIFLACCIFIFGYEFIDSWGWNFPNPEAYVWGFVISIILFFVFAFISSFFLIHALKLEISIKKRTD
jgi:MFS superfamily sulfate permease-like transporter